MPDVSDKRFWSIIKRYFIAGIATIFPVFITIYIIIFLFRFAEDIAGKYVNQFLAGQLGVNVPGLGVLIILLLLIVVGILSTHLIGKKILPVLDRFFKSLPLISNIYPSAKQLSDFMFEAQESDKFKKVVMVDYPYVGSHSLGFVTNEKIEEFDELAHAKLISVFVPLAPLPFTGIILFLPEDKIQTVDITIDQAIKFIMSGGVVKPKSVRRSLGDMHERTPKHRERIYDDSTDQTVQRKDAHVV